MLDRAHWVFGEGGGEFANNYAQAIENSKNWGYHGNGFTEEGVYADMTDGTHSGKKDFFSGNVGSVNYDRFAAARKDPFNLNKLKNAPLAIAAVINQQTGTTTDPTGGATGWYGDVPGSTLHKEQLAKKCNGKIVSETGKSGYTHTFGDRRMESDIAEKSRREQKKKYDKVRYEKAYGEKPCE
jgi:hypothetical protein